MPRSHLGGHLLSRTYVKPPQYLDCTRPRRSASVAFTGGAPKRGPYGIDEAGKGSLSSMHHGTRIYPQWHQKSGGKFLMEVDTCNEQVLQDI